MTSGTLSGFVLNLIDKKFAGRKLKGDFESTYRTDLYKEVSELRAKIEATEKECDLKVEKAQAKETEWMNRYYDQLAQLAPLRGQVAYLEDKIKRMEASDVRRQREQ